MATQRVPILGFGTLPDGSGDVFFEPFSVKATNDEWERLVGVFNDTSTRLVLHFGFVVPQDYASQPRFEVDWAATATTGAVRWEVDYRVVEAGEGLDQSGVEETVGATASAPGTALDLERTTITPTEVNFAAGAQVEGRLVRDGTDAADTMAAAALLFDVLFRYNDV